MGHVSAGQAAQAGAGDDLPGRQHRGTRASRLQGARDLGRFGERLAGAFLEGRGARIVATNLRAGRDEVDLAVLHRGDRVAVEVKTRIGADPVEEFTDEQAACLRRAARGIGASRCDLVAVQVTGDGVQVRWIPGVC